MKSPDHVAVEQLTAKVLDALDWQALGEIYFNWGGEEFWREKLPKLRTFGAELGKALLHRVKPGGSSLWVGAGVAELPVLLAETMLHERNVVATNLREQEVAALNAGLERAGAALRYLTADARTAEGGPFDHLGCISVFTDPELWPVMSDVAYGRVAPVQLDVERFVDERARARELARDVFARLVRPGLITTTFEEVAWFVEQAHAHGTTVEAGDELIETAVVGDPVGFLAVR